MKYPFFLLPLVLLAPLARAQTRPAPTQKPIELRAGHMQAQRDPAANRPDRPPRFPGGPDALSEFFGQHLKYPEAARVNKVTGDVVVTATVGADGRLSSPTITQSLSPACDAEALRVLALLPAWQPATRKGQPVAVLVRLPVPFGNSASVKFE